MDALREWWDGLSGTERALVGFGVPAVAIAALVVVLTDRRADPEGADGQGDGEGGTVPGGPAPAPIGSGPIAGAGPGGADVVPPTETNGAADLVAGELDALHEQLLAQQETWETALAEQAQRRDEEQAQLRESLEGRLDRIASDRPDRDDGPTDPDPEPATDPPEPSPPDPPSPGARIAAFYSGSGRTGRAARKARQLRQRGEHVTTVGHGANIAVIVNPNEASSAERTRMVRNHPDYMSTGEARQRDRRGSGGDDLTGRETPDHISTRCAPGWKWSSSRGKCIVPGNPATY